MQTSLRCLSGAVLCLLVLSLSPSNLPAQTHGEITGVIRDASGAVVPGATCHCHRIRRQTSPGRLSVTRPASTIFRLSCRGNTILKSR